MSNTIRTCHSCGCDAEHACDGGCFWVGQNLCSRCYLAMFIEVAELQGRAVLDQALTELADAAGIAHELLGLDVTARMQERVPAILAEASALPRLWRPRDPI